jgi:protease II
MSLSANHFYYTELSRGCGIRSLSEAPASMLEEIVLDQNELAKGQFTSVGAFVPVTMETYWPIRR